MEELDMTNLEEITTSTKALKKISNTILPILKPIMSYLYRRIPDTIKKSYRTSTFDTDFLIDNKNIFNEIQIELNQQLKNNFIELSKATDLNEVMLLDHRNEIIQKHINFMKIIKESICLVEQGYLSDNSAPRNIPYDNGSIEDKLDTSDVWYDIFEQTAMRRNEPWRNKLIAQCALVEGNISNSISIKTLWEIGMMESITFHAFALFLDSCMFIHGFPCILLDKEDLEVEVHDESKTFQGALFNFMNLLIDEGLVIYKVEPIEYNQPLEVESSGEMRYLEMVSNEHVDDQSFIQIGGYFCTKTGLEVSRLYDANKNYLSELSVIELEKMVSESENCEFKITKRN